MTMPRSTSSIEKIRAELVWVSETPDPNKYGRGKVRYAPVFLLSPGILVKMPKRQNCLRTHGSVERSIDL